MHKPSQITQEQVEQARLRFFARAEKITDLSMQKFADFAAISIWYPHHFYPPGTWPKLVNEWLRDSIHKELEALSQDPQKRNAFNLRKLLDRFGIGETRLSLIIHSSEWGSRLDELPFHVRPLRKYPQVPKEDPGALQLLFDTLNEMITAKTPVSEITKKRVFAKAGISMCVLPTFSKALRATRLILAKECVDHQPDAPAGVNARYFPGGWIDLDKDEWDLRPAGTGRVIERRRLRGDIAEIAWPLMRAELLEGELALSSINNHYTGFLYAAEVLGIEVKDVRNASLEGVQRGWHAYEATRWKRKQARASLVSLFAALFEAAKEDDSIDAKEMLRIAAWLSALATLPDNRPNEDFLSETELDAVAAGCLSEIKVAIDTTDKAPVEPMMTTLPREAENASLVIRWAVALMALIMAFTGLRRQSVIGIKLGDWMEVRKNLFALAWRHGRVAKEHLAILPAAIVGQIEVYVERTASVRKALGTDHVFLLGDHKGNWIPPTAESLSRHLSKFAWRHAIKRGGVVIKLTAQMLRRTYTTRELYEGRSLWALRLQLGHASIHTTTGYVKNDRYEHPAHVRASLDEYGRKALTLWHDPIILGDLEPAEREKLLGHFEARCQGTGLCRHETCQKASQGTIPPCSLCEHLVTDANFLNEWEAEDRRWQERLERLKGTPDGNHLYAQMKYQYDRFKANYTYVRERSAG
jgi:integrase